MPRGGHNKGKPGPRRPVADRFWPKVDRSGGPDACWPWTGVILKSGYGNFKRGRPEGVITAPRMAWTLANGQEIPAGLVVRHACDNRACCNPAHLSIGTHADNVADKVAKGRQGAKRHLSEEQVRTIKARLAAGHLQKDIARDIGIGESTIGAIKSGRLWKWVKA